MSKRGSRGSEKGYRATSEPLARRHPWPAVADAAGTTCHNDAHLICYCDMRTTLDLDDNLLRRAKQLAVERGQPLRRVVEEALRAMLSERPRRSGYSLEWRTRRGRLRPGVDVNDRDALYERMEERG